MKIVHVNLLLDGEVPKLVGGAVGDTWLDPATGEPVGEETTPVWRRRAAQAAARARIEDSMVVV